MTDKLHEDGFKIENCRAKARGTGGLVDCLALKQAGICGFSISFGDGYFCKHPDRNKIITETEKIKKRFKFNFRSRGLKSNKSNLKK